MQVNPDIFRQYDIRGVADRDLDDTTILNLGRAFGTESASRLNLRHPRIGVGRDMRISSKRLFTALTDGLREAGVHVVDLGMVPTPLVYFARIELELDGCIMITGSHNPGEYNGFKMMIGADTIYGDSIQGLRKRIEAEDYVTHDARPIVAVDDLKAKYLHWCKNHAEMGPRTLKVAVDCGNGMGGVIAPQLVEVVLGQDTISMFAEPDGNFPNHHADPTVPENLEHLIAMVKKEKCDVGVSYDGDADRIGVVDENGEIIWGDKLMILFARQVLEEHPGATIIGEVKCSQTLFDAIEENGGKAVMSQVGHSLIKAKIQETGAKLAGEMSGHIFFADRYFGFDDALYATLRLLEILSHSDKTLSELLADIPKTFATPEIRKDCPEDVKFGVPSKVADAFSAKYKVNTLDGVRVNFGDGWGLVRASNTQPVLVMRVEANTAERRDALLAELELAVENALKA